MNRSVSLNLTLALVSAAVLVIACLFGSSDLSGFEAISALFGQANARAEIIVYEIRMARALAAFGVGAALGASGALLQGLLRNVLADPGVLGVSASASLGAVIAIYFGLSAYWAFATPVMAILFALGAMAILLAASATGLGTIQLILAGVGLSSFAGALTALAINLSPNPFALSDLITWMLGSVANRSFLDLSFALPFWLIGGGLAVLTLPGLRALSLGDETAISLGVNLKRLRGLVILSTALLTGGAIAIAGVIGFVGIIAPHVLRPFVHHDPARLVLPSALLGGALLTLTDLLIRVAPLDQELRLGVMAALIGAPVFVWIAIRTRGIGQ